ncbi:hypothetical protein [Marinicrinis lubricantis]|uniref:Uncharacterized protein n=1 Tax=Marinicrinis lubricantis TaxID=2086470 RepID=A0ABW1IVD5_9BACL
MGTRLLSEHVIKKHYPALRYVRVHTDGKYSAAVYAWNDDLTLPEQDAIGLKRFISGYLLSHVCYKIKEYHMVQADGVPVIHEVPEIVRNAAMRRSLNQHGIIEIMNRMFPSGRLTYDRYDARTATIHFHMESSAPLQEWEKESIDRCLYEMIPIGTFCTVAYNA